MSELSERFNKLISRMNELEDNPSELTKDILLADLRELYEVVKSVKTVKSEVVVDQVKEEPKAEELQENPEPEPEPALVAETITDENVVEPVVEPTSEAMEMEEPEPEPVQKPVAKKQVETMEPLTAEKTSFIGKEEPNSKTTDDKILAGQLSRKPLEDLRTGIPLNEKFGIIRSLFKGNASDYGDAVLKLNNAASIPEMKHYLNLLHQRFGWDLESESYQAFYVYVERKMLMLETSDANSDK